MSICVLDRQNVRFVALRCAGFNQVGPAIYILLGIKIAPVPTYSSYALAESALALVLALNRRIHRAYNRVRDGNFSIDGFSVSISTERPSVSSEPKRLGAFFQAS